MLQASGLAFEEFEDAMRGVNGYFTPLERQPDDWGLLHVALEDIELMVGRNGSGSVYQGACCPNTFGLFFPLSTPSSVAVNCKEVGLASLSWLATKQEFHVYHSGALDWVGVTVGARTVNRWLGVANESFPLRLQHHASGCADALQMDVLKDLVTRIFNTHGNAATMSPRSTRTIYEQLSWALYEAIQSIRFDRPKVSGRPKLSREEVIARTLRLLDASNHESIHVPDICQATGISSRTLHAIFMESFGISPQRFLVLHRLRRIRDALWAAEPEETVGSICSRFGVWDFGRFAGLYKDVYGVHPSAVLAGIRRSRHEQSTPPSCH